MILWIWECTHQHFVLSRWKRNKSRKKNYWEIYSRERDVFIFKFCYNVLLFRIPFSNFKFSLNFTRISWIFPSLINKQKRVWSDNLFLLLSTPIRCMYSCKFWMADTQRQNTRIGFCRKLAHIVHNLFIIWYACGWNRQLKVCAGWSFVYKVCQFWLHLWNKIFSIFSIQWILISIPPFSFIERKIFHPPVLGLKGNYCVKLASWVTLFTSLAYITGV